MDQPADVTVPNPQFTETGDTGVPVVTLIGEIAALADPLVNVPTNLSGLPGSTVTAPINIDNAEGLVAADLIVVLRQHIVKRPGCPNRNGDKRRDADHIRSRHPCNRNDPDRRSQ